MAVWRLLWVRGAKRGRCLLLAEEPWLLHVLTVLGQLDDCVSSGVYSQSQRGSEQSRLAIPRRQDVWSALGLCGVTVVLPVPPSAMSGPLLCSRCLWPSEQMTRKLRLGGACQKALGCVFGC